MIFVILHYFVQYCLKYCIFVAKYFLQYYVNACNSSMFNVEDAYSQMLVYNNFTLSFMSLHTMLCLLQYFFFSTMTLFTTLKPLLCNFMSNICSHNYLRLVLYILNNIKPIVNISIEAALGNPFNLRLQTGLTFDNAVAMRILCCGRPNCLKIQ